MTALDRVRTAMTLDDRIDDITHAHVWSRIEGALAASSPHRARWPLAALCAAAAAVAIVMLARRGDVTETLTAPPNTTLAAHLGPHTRAALVGPARVEIVGKSGDATAIRLRSGTLLAEFAGGAGRSLRIEAPGAMIEIVGTVFAIEVIGDGSCISVGHGTVRVTPARGARALVTAGRRWCTASARLDAIPPALKDALEQHAIRTAAVELPPASAGSPPKVALGAPESNNAAASPPVAPPASRVAATDGASPPAIATYGARAGDAPAPAAVGTRGASRAAAIGQDTTRSNTVAAATTAPTTLRNATTRTNAVSASGTPRESSGAPTTPQNTTRSNAGPTWGTTSESSGAPTSQPNAAMRSSSAPTGGTTNESSAHDTRSSAPTTGDTAPRDPELVAHGDGATREAPPAAKSASDPAGPDVLYGVAERALAKHDLGAADRALAQITDRQPASPLAAQALYDRARIAYQQHAWARGQRQLDRLAALGPTALTEPGAYLACRIALAAGDDGAERCFVDYRAAYPRSPHDLDVLGVLVDIAYRTGGCARAAGLQGELRRRYPASPLARGWAERCEEHR